MSAALECQQLSHHSDFETGSESGLSDLSYVSPYQPRKFPKCNRSESTLERTVSKRGARATRRYENEAFLNTLSVIAEADIDDANTSLPLADSLCHCSTFAKLFEDENLRLVWTKFINLSEIEQAKLLGTLRRLPLGYTSKTDVSDDSDSDVNAMDFFGNATSCRVGGTHGQRSKTRVRRSKRGHRKPKLIHHMPVTCPQDGDGPEQAANERLSALCLEEDTVWERSTQPELRGLLPARVRSLLLPPTGTRSRRRMFRRNLTPLDLCLLRRTETELRDWFTGSRGTTLVRISTSHSNSNRNSWTPTISLLGDVELLRWWTDNENFPEALLLEPFERALVHSVATYLGLSSLSTWSDTAGVRQLWVQPREGHPFNPPQPTMVSVLKACMMHP